MQCIQWQTSTFYHVIDCKQAPNYTVGYEAKKKCRHVQQGTLFKFFFTLISSHYLSTFLPLLGACSQANPVVMLLEISWLTFLFPLSTESCLVLHPYG